MKLKSETEVNTLYLIKFKTICYFFANFNIPAEEYLARAEEIWLIQSRFRTLISKIHS